VKNNPSSQVRSALEKDISAVDAKMDSGAATANALHVDVVNHRGLENVDRYAHLQVILRYLAQAYAKR